MRAPEEFQTNRLRLRPVALADAEEIFQTYAGEAEPTLFMPFVRHRDIAESLTFAERCDGCWKIGSAFPWAIIDKASGKLIAVLELRLSPPKADFGFILGKPFWGYGFASEAASAVVEWAITQPEIFRVWATCHPRNVASASVLRKAGLRLEATPNRPNPTLNCHGRRREAVYNRQIRRGHKTPRWLTIRGATLQC